MFRNLLSNTALAMGLLASGSAFAACPNGTSATNAIAGKETCMLSGTYLNDLALTSDKSWVLSGAVFIGSDNKNNATLAIEPGTKIYGFKGPDFLVIQRGSKIIADGTKDRPIIFTTPENSNRRRGMWGGLYINGNAPINSCLDNSASVCEAQGEVGTGLYGGSNPHDNSGILRYVRIEWAGYRVTDTNELNGISFQGVGDGTIAEYLQVHMNADDGVEFFGGTVNVRYVYLTGNGDDSFDWTSGWTGRAQFVVIQSYGDEADSGIEADNNQSPMDAMPRSFPILSNFTMIGAADGSSGFGALLRYGTGVEIYNTVITNFKKGCLNVDHAETFNAGLIMENTTVWCPNSQHFVLDATDPWNIEEWFLNQPGNKVVNPVLNGYIPAANSPLLYDAGMLFDPWFLSVDFTGAVRDASSDWTKGWTSNDRS